MAYSRTLLTFLVSSAIGIAPPAFASHDGLETVIGAWLVLPVGALPLALGGISLALDEPARTRAGVGAMVTGALGTALGAVWYARSRGNGAAFGGATAIMGGVGTALGAAALLTRPKAEPARNKRVHFEPLVATTPGRSGPTWGLAVRFSGD